MRDNRPIRHFNKSYTGVINDFREYLIYERQLAETTIYGYVFFVCEFLEFASKDIMEIKKEDIRDFIKHLRAKELINSSISNYIVSLRVFYNWYSDKCKSNDLVEVAFFLQKVMRIRKDKGVPEVPTQEELEKLRETLHAYKKALSYNKASMAYKLVLRDTAIFETLVATGARSFEIRNMRVCDININSETVFIWAGKGNKQRVSVFNEIAKHTLKEHIEHNRFSPNDNVFVIRNGNMLNYIVKRWAKRSGINEKIHTHSFRHFHVTEAQRRGVPVQVVADQVGHANLNTTRHYTHFDVEYRREQYENCKI